MSDENQQKNHGMTKSYLGFIDTSVLFKKPISCLAALVSLLFPVHFFFQIIQYDVFSTNNGKLIIAALLVLAVLIFSGVFGFLIWWHRRIRFDDGAKIYPNFRRFIQTSGEWAGTVFAINVLFCVLIPVLLLKNEYYYLAQLLIFPIPGFDMTFALLGPVIGFLIIIASRIFLFLLDPIIWLVKKIWALFVRIVLYFYRCTIKWHGVVEQHTSVWMGIIWLLSAIVVVAGLSFCSILFIYPSSTILWCGVITIALGLGMMAFLVIRRKNHENNN